MYKNNNNNNNKNDDLREKLQSINPSIANADNEESQPEEFKWEAPLNTLSVANKNNNNNNNEEEEFKWIIAERDQQPQRQLITPSTSKYKFLRQPKQPYTKPIANYTIVENLIRASVIGAYPETLPTAPLEDLLLLSVPLFSLYALVQLTTNILIPTVETTVTPMVGPVRDRVDQTIGVPIRSGMQGVGEAIDGQVNKKEGVVQKFTEKIWGISDGGVKTEVSPPLGEKAAPTPVVDNAAAGTVPTTGDTAPPSVTETANTVDQTVGVLPPPIRNTIDTNTVATPNPTTTTEPIATITTAATATEPATSLVIVPPPIQNAVDSIVPPPPIIQNTVVDSTTTTDNAKVPIMESAGVVNKEEGVSSSSSTVVESSITVSPPNIHNNVDSTTTTADIYRNGLEELNTAIRNGMAESSAAATAKEADVAVAEAESVGDDFAGL